MYGKKVTFLLTLILDLSIHIKKGGKASVALLKLCCFSSMKNNHAMLHDTILTVIWAPEQKNYFKTILHLNITKGGHHYTYALTLATGIKM